MGRQSKWEYFRAVYARYEQADRETKQRMGTRALEGVLFGAGLCGLPGGAGGGVFARGDLDGDPPPHWSFAA